MALVSPADRLHDARSQIHVPRPYQFAVFALPEYSPYQGLNPGTSASSVRTGLIWVALDGLTESRTGAFDGSV